MEYHVATRYQKPNPRHIRSLLLHDRLCIVKEITNNREIRHSIQRNPATQEDRPISPTQARRHPVQDRFAIHHIAHNNEILCPIKNAAHDQSNTYLTNCGSQEGFPSA
jgi:hypothetical protein